MSADMLGRLASIEAECAEDGKKVIL